MYKISPSPAVVALTLLLLSAAYSRAGVDLASLKGVWTADFNEDASRIIVRMRSGKLGLWDSRTGEPITGDLGTLKTSGSYVVDENARQVLVGFSEGGSCVFDFATGKAISQMETSFQDNWQSRAVFNPGGTQVAIFDKDGKCKIHDVKSGTQITALDHVPAQEDGGSEPWIKFGQSAPVAFLLDGVGTLQCYDTSTWKKKGAPMPHPNRDAYAFGFSISEDLRYAATFDGPGENGPDGFLQLWDLSSSKTVGDLLSGKNGLSGRFIKGRSRMLLSPGRGDAKIVEIPSLETEFVLPRHDDVEASRVSFVPGDSRVLSWGYDSRVCLSNSRFGTLEKVFSSRARPTSILGYPSRNSALLACDNTVFLLASHFDFYILRIDLKTMRPVSTLRVTDYLHRSILSPDGSRLMVHTGKSGHERIRIFDSKTLVEVPFTD